MGSTVNIRPALNEERYHIDMSRHAREHERRHAFIVSNTDCRVVLEQQPNAFDVPFEGGPHQSGHAIGWRYKVDIEFE